MKNLALETKQDCCEPAAASPLGAAAQERSCIVTRQIRAPDELIRFVLGPDHSVVPDLKRKLPGRGAWVGLSKTLVAQAVKKQLFSRSLKEKAVAAPDLPDLIEALMRRDALQSLSLVNKAGLVTTGFAKVEARLAAGDVVALLHARDGAADGKRKLRQAAHRRFRSNPPAEFDVFTIGELDAALGRNNVVHAVVISGPAAKVFLASARRLALYRGDGETEAPGGGDELTKNEALAQDCNADANGRDARKKTWDA